MILKLLCFATQISSTLFYLPNKFKPLHIEESIGGQSKADFFAKITIAYKETRESKYWIRLLRDSEYLTNEQSEDLLKDVEELLKIIGSIQKTVRNS